MTIQPLVENAIHHAAEKMLDVCVIRVSGAATVSYTHLDVYKRQVLDQIEQADLDKLDGIAAGANKYVHPTSSGSCLLYTSRCV